MTNVRKSTLEDLSTLCTLVHKFILYSPYTSLVNNTTVDTLITSILNTTDNTKVILTYEDTEGIKGFIAGFTTPFIYGSILQASELAWWVEPEYRNSSIGDNLLSSFEQWATDAGASIVCMSSLNDKLDMYYEKNGYKFYEKTYMKQLWSH